MVRTAYGMACDIYADAFIKYRGKKAERTKYYKEKEERVTIIADMVQGDTLEEKKELLMAEGKKKTCEKWVMAYENRVNTFKFIGRKTDKLAN